MMKLSLILNAIDPLIGGVLIRGEKGTAKSTAVRALAAVLPEIEVFEGCAYSCDPCGELCDNCINSNGSAVRGMRPVRMTTLPLNSTEDMIVGSLDFESAIKSGKRVFQPGLLARVNRGILYIDEVNLLDDHIVDIILDSSSSGYNVVEREGISYCHQSEFILVGTMNPEEGDLRPQFIDRFGLCVEVKGCTDMATRIRLMKHREEFDFNPHGFIEKYTEENQQVRESIINAREILDTIIMPKNLKKYISELCLSKNVAGHRADIIIQRAAIALTALRKKREVTLDEILLAAELALVHRTREASNSAPLPPEPDDDNDEQENEESPENEDQNDDQDNEKEETPPPPPPQNSEEENSEHENDENQPDQNMENASVPDFNNMDMEVKDEMFDIGEVFKVKTIRIDKDRKKRRGSGKRMRTKTSQKQGRYVKSVFNRNDNDIAFDATIRAAAPFQKIRGKNANTLINIKNEDIRTKEREKKISNFLLFTVDASGSMGARGRMIASKGAVMSLLLDAYQKRDKVGMVAFRKKDAELVLPPTSSVDLAASRLKEMPVGGRTPLSIGLSKTFEVLNVQLIKEPSSKPVAVIITDGKSNVAAGNDKPVDEALQYAEKMSREERIKFIVIDSEEKGMVTFGLARKLASALHAEYFKIEDLKASDIVNVINRSK